MADLIVGNDIARYQGNIDWDTYKHNTHFVIIKATEGVGYTDPKFIEYRREARARNIPLGYYHFARPDFNNNPVAEAQFFISVVGPDIREGEVVCLDYEPKSNPFDVVVWCFTFLYAVEQKLGVKPFIYLNKSQVKSFDWQAVVQAGYPLWLACYDGNPVIGVWPRETMRQWTSSQKVPGIVGNVDGDHFFGNLEQFLAFGYKRHASSSVSPSLSPSPSLSDSPSLSPSPSASPSKSASPSISPSLSVSPSPSNEIPPMTPEQQLVAIERVIDSPWRMWGKYAWYKRRQEIRDILLADWT